jgi:hypothetical protein
VPRACQAPVAAVASQGVDAGLRLLEDGYQPAGLIEESIAARSGAPPPSGGRARMFQQQVLEEISGSRR